MDRPLAMVVPESRNGAAIFTVASQEVTIECDLPRLLTVITLCNGLNTPEEISDKSGVPPGEIRELMEALEEHLIVLEATEAFRIFHRYSSTDSPFFHELSEDQVARITQSPHARPEEVVHRVPVEPPPMKLGRLLKSRASSDSTTPCPVLATHLFAMLTGMYGQTGASHRAVPSAGGLYPLCLQVVIQKDCHPLKPGVWWFDTEDTSLCLLRARQVSLRSVFIRDEVTEIILANSTAIIFISVDFDRIAKKYANRGYRYGLIEAGAAMQNAYLVAAELGIPIRAIGGFDDRATQALLSNKRDTWPVLCLTLGG